MLTRFNKIYLRLSYVDDGYSCLKQCHATDNDCLSNYTKEILYQYRSIPSINSLNEPLEVSACNFVLASTVKDIESHSNYGGAVSFGIHNGAPKQKKLSCPAGGG